MHSDFFKERIAKLKGEEGQKQLKSVKELAEFAEKGDTFTPARVCYAPLLLRRYFRR